MSDDLISREAAIDCVCENCEYYKNDEMKQSLMQLPSAMRWIPVREKLPDESQWVTVTVELDGRRHTSVRLYSLTYGFVVLGRGERVVAWQPIPKPKPYEEVSE